MPDLPERELNARLRRADWRFLLPSPAPRRAFVRAERALSEAVASIAGEVVTGEPGGECDLAVGEDPDEATLACLHDALCPGGACYTEWHLALGGARRVERALQAAGFEAVACYRPWPATAALPIYWIPVGAPGASSYVRARTRLRGGRLRRLRTGVGRRAQELARGRFGRPICAIARRPPGPEDPALDPAAWLLEGWPEWGLGTPPGRLSTLLVTGGPRSVSKVVLLGFAEPSPAPLVAIKAPRVEGAAAGVRRESEVLAAMAAGRRLRGVPRLLFSREPGGVPVVGETALAGNPLESRLGSRSLRIWSLKVAEWLAALADGRPPRPAAHWRATLVEPALARFVEEFGGVVDRGLLREAEGLLRAVGALPPVPEQRDFGPWNLLVTPTGELGVLDWESAVLEGLPALDLLYFLAYAGFRADRAHDRESRVVSYRRSLDPATPTGAVRREALTRYLAALGLDPALLGPLRVLIWLIHTPSDRRHAAADAGGAPPPDALARSLFLALWAEEVRAVARG